MSKRVVVCDDAKFMRQVLKGILEKNGCKVVGEAENGEEISKVYSKLKPDIVFMDITMPIKNGIDAVKDIKAINPNAKVIMCSAMGQQTMVVEALKAGAIDFIVKPFEADRIVEAVAKV